MFQKPLKPFLILLIILAFPLEISATSATSQTSEQFSVIDLENPQLATAGDFSATESEIITEAKTIFNSFALKCIIKAHAAKQSLIVIVDGRLIQYEPGLPASGMTMFGENGFLIGREAFTVPGELERTVLHELHRLTTSNSADGVNAELAEQETKAAADFAERAAKFLDL